MKRIIFFTLLILTACSGQAVPLSTPPTVSIQQMVDAAPMGSVVSVPSGIYQRTVIKKALTVQCLGDCSTKGFEIFASNVTVKGFEISFTDAMINGNPTHAAGVFVQGSNNVIEDNYIHDTKFSGIYLDGKPSNATSTGNIFRNNYIYHVQDVAIYVGGRNTTVEGNEIEKIVQWLPGVVDYNGRDTNGMTFFGQGHIIRNNYIHSLYIDKETITAHIDCFQTWSSAYGEAASNITFSGNHCDLLTGAPANTGGNGFMLANASNLTITNNVIETRTGINTTGGGNSRLAIEHNVFSNSLAKNNTYPEGVELVNSPYSTLKNNLFYNQPAATVLIFGDKTGTMVDANLAWNESGLPKCMQTDGYICAPIPARHYWGINPLVDATFRPLSGSPMCLKDGYIGAFDCKASGTPSATNTQYSPSATATAKIATSTPTFLPNFTPSHTATERPTIIVTPIRVCVYPDHAELCK